jgi:hypothetical protein
MTFQVPPAHEGRLWKQATRLIDLLWEASLVITFAFAAILTLVLAIGLAVQARAVQCSLQAAV